MCLRVLLVEDDERIRRALSLALSDEGFAVDESCSGEEALPRLEKEPFDVVLVDLTLPGLDGLELVRTLRSRGDLPIIVVTARTDARDVIAGLEAGADDYVTKPLMASVLAARIRALLRRRGPGREFVRIGDLEIRPQEGLVHRAGERVHLTRTEFRLLLELAGAGGRIVTREQLLQKVWGYDYFGDTRLLDVHMRRLRRKVETNPDDPALLLTVRGTGYRIGS
ncbi:DNA-binding response regulator, OmpR family, contains REC and winged-helix (wHTH) domain [Lentzea xinjiangensis]|uniref:DNA-binding response regulator, OmpR family, contains REC and winged-helix (WHTH) domain n=1 Tax=Lentzea xinjiangensis TaxID=402600 RepID=A0A1H9WRX5_9PSEU|nr:response regulator transcription factor [Lentzea xinjiangensis]SES36417.1 DNA-binding response regulator, OmpR family, contains REC and winged-helix (wHTH) domain [Lentzea xinjiangensis]